MSQNNRFLITEILTVPAGLRVFDLTWNFFKLSWSGPTQRWLPTFYNARACLIVFPTNCVQQNNIKSLVPLDFDGLLELREYKVEIEAVLEPVDIKAASNVLITTRKLNHIDLLNRRLTSKQSLTFAAYRKNILLFF